MSVSGPNVTEVSEMSPKSKTIVGFFDRSRTVRIWAQNSRFSACEMSAPLGLSTVRTERHRRPGVAFGTVQRKAFVAGFRGPAMEAGESVSQRRGSGAAGLGA